MSMPGLLEFAAIAVVALIVFGPQRLPQIGKSVGGAIKEFRNAVHGGGNGSEKTPGNSAA